MFIVDEVRRASKEGFYYLALTLALKLPDICAALQSPDGETSGRKYKDWCKTYVLPKYPRLSASDVYYLRCGVLHQGRCGHPDMQYSRVVFTMPDAAFTVHNNIMGDALNLNVSIFCEDICKSVESWQGAIANDARLKAVVEANSSKLVTLHPNGLAPFIVGLPVIA